MKKRILFVEDNSLLLEMYAMMMEPERGQWEVVTAEDARQALQLLEKVSFDVVVSDLRMPGMDGLEFLEQVRQRLPGCSRIMISGLSDQGEVVRSLNSIHQFLPKPVEAKALRETLARILGLDAYLQDDKLKALVGHLGALPSFPALYLEVMKEISRPDPSIEKVSEIIAKDAAMTAKMLQLANSAAVGLARKVSHPFEAIQFLGISTVRSLVLSAHIFSCFEHTNLKGLSVPQLWSHTLRTGRIARMILRLENTETDGEDAHIAGMLHDMGKLMLADALPDQYQRALALAGEARLSMDQAEEQILGASHAGVAAYLLGLWGFPAGIVEAVAFHHAPRRSQTPALGPLAAVHIANAFEHQLSNNQGSQPVAEFDDDYVRSIGAETRLDAWRDAARELLQVQ